MTLIVGLGNAGRAYTNNGHNIGFRCLGHLAKQYHIRLNRQHGRARTGVGEISGVKVVLARPQTFMNASGESVSRLVHRWRLTPDSLTVIHDDLDLPPGKIRIRRGGSPAGHKGVASIIDHLGSQDFIRIRIGIGRPSSSEDMLPGEDSIISYVLSNFNSHEYEIIEKAIIEVGDAVYCLLKDGILAAMNRYN